MGKDKGRTEKQKPCSDRDRQGKDKGRTREEQRNKSHIDVGKDKGRTGKHYPYLYKERQGKT